jgi:triacylglycerol esterase/lipase EstA (alpha/beta hydrolase family)
MEKTLFLNIIFIKEVIMKRFLCILLTALLLTAGTVTKITASALVIPAPTLINNNLNGNEGDIYIGAIPVNVDTTKPVIVFVQGMNGKAQDWWQSTRYYGNNDMYNYAYNSGYRTAFVNFRDSDGNAASMWRNGSVLRTQLEQICNYFGVQKVNIVCHSKGGIDTQSAIVHYGAYPYVDKVFTLSTPHWGSQTADLAYSWYAGWLASLLGSKSDATYVLQTGYMSYFRSITDNRSENNTVSYYTSAGTDWGPWFSALWNGGLYLSNYGSNDGLVTVANAKNPRAIHVNTGSLNHDNIRMGSRVWWYVQPKVGTYSANTISSQLQTMTVESEQITNSKASGNNLLRGGQIKGIESFDIPVDTTADSVTFDLMVADPNVKVNITSPDGTVYTPENKYNDDGYFKGAAHLITIVDAPKAGKWNISIDSKKKNAYLLITNFGMSGDVTLTADKSSVKAGENLALEINFNGKLYDKVKDAKICTKLCKANLKENSSEIKEFRFESKDKKYKKDLTMPTEPGLYNLNISIEGILDDGSAFEREIVQSVVVEPETVDRAQYLKKLIER